MIKKSVRSRLKCNTLLCEVSITYGITPSMSLRMVGEYLKGLRRGMMFSRRGRDGDVPYYSFTETDVFVGEISIFVYSGGSIIELRVFRAGWANMTAITCDYLSRVKESEFLGCYIRDLNIKKG